MRIGEGCLWFGCVVHGIGLILYLKLMADEEGGAPYQFTPCEGPNEGKTGNSSRDFTGVGLAVYPNTDQYHGHYNNGTREGHGKYIYANGDRYEGAFVDNKKHGVGRFCTKDKGEYYGWDGLRQGSGKTG